MILVEERGGRAEHLLVIRQTDHALLAGFFAKEWANEEFTTPQPNGFFCLAVAEHDNGWSDWELQPTLDPKTHLPFSFMSIPTETHVALYQRGIKNAWSKSITTRRCWSRCTLRSSTTGRAPPCPDTPPNT